MLESKCPICGRNLDTGYKCPACSVYISPKQDMKTPTKEQIDYIAKVIFVTNKEEPITELQYEGLCEYWDRTVKKDTKRKYRARAKVAIETWEKIRNS